MISEESGVTSAVDRATLTLRDVNTGNLCTVTALLYCTLYTVHRQRRVKHNLCPIVISIFHLLINSRDNI